ncbi:hypothetical protein ACFPM0_08215 [Pseudonocardia sulfidoxydans]|uniref:hypothetical protein n=1 Tax=Pseudonocardia sulfidoxydans TaxID=54011 RepID=UPI003618931B
MASSHPPGSAYRGLGRRVCGTRIHARTSQVGSALPADPVAPWHAGRDATSRSPVWTPGKTDAHVRPGPGRGRPWRVRVSAWRAAAPRCRRSGRGHR